MKGLFRLFTHAVFRTRTFNDQCLRRFSQRVRGKKILELGSGKKARGEYPYSAKKLFHPSNEFIQSDIVKEYGHQVVDVTTMNFKEKFDVVLCMNVLEHVYDFHKAVKNIHRALKKNGVASVFVPGYYPLHNEPQDYWRFTEHSLLKMFSRFSQVRIVHSGVRQYPFAYYVQAKK